MPTPATVTLFSSANPKFLFTSPASTNLILKAPSPPRTVLVRCSSQEREIGSLKEALSGMLGNQVEELMNREENRSLMEGLEIASQRVDKAKEELAEIERQEIEARLLRTQIDQLEKKASEIAECQKELAEARTMVEEAERSLLLSMDGDGSEDALKEKESEEDKDEERLESVKAALISALIGTLAGLPLSLIQVTSIPQLILDSAVTFISCALFGVTFRYTIRRDLDNVQLKTGTSAAFGFVKGLATLAGGLPLELDNGSLLSHASDGAVYVSKNLTVFIFAAVGLDFCFKMRLLCPFPIRKSSFEGNTTSKL